MTGCSCDFVESGLTPRHPGQTPQAASHKRFAALDTLRGVLCLLLALDNAVFFSGKRIAGEFFWEKSMQLKGQTVVDVLVRAYFLYVCSVVVFLYAFWLQL